MRKKLWRKNFAIRRTHFQMGSPALSDMIKLQDVTAGQRALTEVVWLQKGFDNIGTYFKRAELRVLINQTLKTILNKPDKIDAIHARAIEYNKEFFNYGGKIQKINFKELTNKQLIKIYQKWAALLIYSHGWALPTTWFIDSDGEDFSKFLFGRIQDILKKQRVKLNPAEIFSIMTTPVKSSFAAKEEIESLKIARLISGNAKAKKLFSKKNFKEIEAGLEDIDKNLKRKIIRHYKKWRWVPYTYMGPAHELGYYLEIWSGIIRQKINLNKELKRLLAAPADIKNKQRNIVKKLKINSFDKHLFNIAADIIYLKAFRKDCWFYGCFAVENLYKEIGLRLGLSLNQVWMMGWWEVVPALKRGEFKAEIINQRIKFSVLHQKGNRGNIYSGQKARNFLKKLTLEKEKIIKVDELSGTSAYVGKAKGRVKVINLPEEMDKMKKGDIMISHTTFPSLVPAMKLAAAIVTDDGGITCHAAIVARELKTPCVVGTHVATQVLRDGDLVEVDADRGIVKKI